MGLLAAAPTGEPGSAATTRTAPAPAPAVPAATDLVRTRATYRQLLTKGLAPEEAANLTAMMCGIPVADVHWSLHQINQMLFMRELARTGRFGHADGGTPPTR